MFIILCFFVSSVLQLKSVGPKLVPFFKTLAIYFVLFGDGSKLESIFYCAIKCLPIISLIIFVLLHGMSFSEYYAYSRKILIGLIFSGLGDAFMVWKSMGYFVHGIAMFAMAQVMYASAFGLKPINPYAGIACSLIAATTYNYIYPGLNGALVFLTLIYILLICFMMWRAIARVQFFNDLWTWTKLCGCAGAMFFMISDFVIAWDRFVLPVPYSHQIIMVTYYAAQLGITLSVVDSQVDAFLEVAK